MAPQGRSRGNDFYLAVGLYVALLGLIGFARSFYFLPLGSTPLPGAVDIYPGVLIHGLCFTAWMALAVWQPWLIRQGRHDAHRRFGRWMGVLAILLITSGIYVGMVQASRRLAETGSAAHFSVPLVIMIGFTLTFGFAIYFRNKGEWHKRWIVISHAQLLEPAAARSLATFELPVFPPILLLIALPVLAGAIYDTFKLRKVPWLYLLGLIIVLGSGFFRHALPNHPGWIDFTAALFSPN